MIERIIRSCYGKPVVAITLVLAGEVELLSGLQPGETVVVEGAFLLKAEAEKRAGGGDEHGH